MQKALLLRVGSIILLMLLLLVPLGMIRGVVAERQQLQQQVENTVAGSFAGSQRLVGPLLIVPYVERELVVSTDDRGKETRRNVEHQRRVLIGPTLLNYDGAAEIEAKHKGIYKAIVYQTKGAWRARFDVPANFGIDVDPARINIGSPYLSFGMTDVRGIRGTPSINWAGREVTVSSGTKFGALGDGLHADVGELGAGEARHYEAVININVAGTRSLAFAPVGKSVAVQLQAPWPHPNFGGRFLPLSKKIDADGFSARWDISHLSSKNHDLLLLGAREQVALETFDISFIEPVNIYQQAERAVKYGVLFVALTFAAFFLFETLKDLRIHPMQYGLVGLALAVFFLLLVSLSEHISFLMAYVAASACCVLLIGYYLAHVLQGWRRGAVFGAKLVVLYGVLYGLLLSEDNALMLGSILLFAALAVFMVLTRRLDWYRLGSIK